MNFVIAQQADTPGGATMAAVSVSLFFVVLVGQGLVQGIQRRAAVAATA